MLRINCYLNNGDVVTIYGTASGKELASSICEDGHESETGQLKEYLARNVHVSATVKVNGRAVGAWSV